MPRRCLPLVVLARRAHRAPSSLPARHRSEPSFARILSVPFIAVCLSAEMFAAWTPACAQSAPGRPITRIAVTSRFEAFVAEASHRFGIPAAWIRAVMHAESFGEVRAISPKGAMGLMQIMPETWDALRRRYALGVDPYDAHDNIMAGAAYLRELHDRYGIPGFLAAYNAGPARWEDHLATGRPLPAETRAYLTRLAPIVGGSAIDDTALLASIVRSWTQASLFPEQRSDMPSDKTTAAQPRGSTNADISPAQDWTGLAPQSDGLFVALSSAGRSQ
jgi:soluble lytic murein transglycosylase-like protein